MILITTTRRPARRTRSFVRELYHVIPGAHRVNRGKSSIEDLNELALSKGLSRLLIVGTRAGNPSFLMFYSTNPLRPLLLNQIILRGVTLRREFTKRRAPFSRTMGITYQGDLRNLAKELARGFSLSDPISVNREEIPNLKGELDLVLHLSGGGEVVHSTFYYVYPFHEVGPRIRIKGYKVFEGEDSS